MKQIIIRIIALPIFAIFHLIVLVVNWIFLMAKYIKYGGETIIYERGDRKMIHDIYQLLKSKKTIRFNS
jgi:hypothetical protein